MGHVLPSVSLKSSVTAETAELFSAAAHPKINFTVVINPCNGPCTNGVPEKPYLEEIPKLKNYTNVQTLGYVATNYSNKAIDSVLQEIRTWSNWTQSNKNDLVGVDGIFFDEVPGDYEWEKYDYLQKATNEVKAAAGLGRKTVGRSHEWRLHTCTALLNPRN
jgi:hypothetical protein